MGSKKKAKKRKQHEKADMENENFVKTKKLKPNDLKTEQTETEVSQETLLVTAIHAISNNNHTKKNKTQDKVLKESNGKNNKLSESTAENNPSTLCTKSKKKKRRHRINVEINPVEKSNDAHEIKHEIVMIESSINEDKKLKKKKKKKQRKEEEISSFKENLINNSTNSTELIAQKKFKRKNKKHRGLKENQQDSTLHNGVISNDVITISNDSENLEIKKHKKHKKKKELNILNQSAETIVTTIAISAADNVGARTLNNDQASFPYSSQIKLKKHKKKKKKHKSLHQASSITSNSTIIDITNDGAQPMNENEPSFKLLKHRHTTNNNGTATVKSEYRYNANRLSSSMISFHNDNESPTSNIINKKKKRKKKKERDKHIKTEKIEIEYPVPMTNDISVQNDAPSSSRNAAGSPTENEACGSAFANLFNKTLSQPDAVKDQKNDGKTAVNFTSTTFDFYSSKVNRKKYTPFMSPFSRTDHGEHIDVVYYNTEKAAQNQVFCRNIISYNRDVNNMSLAYKKLDTPVYRYCSNEPSRDIFISDFEISDEDEEASSNDTSFISFIKPPPNENVTLYHPPADFHP